MLKLIFVFLFAVAFITGTSQAQALKTKEDNRPQIGVKSMTINGESEDNKVTIPKKGGKVAIEAVIAVPNMEILRGSTMEIEVRRDSGEVKFMFKDDDPSENSETIDFAIDKSLMIYEPGKEITVKFTAIVPEGNKKIGSIMIDVSIRQLWKMDSDGNKIYILTNTPEKDEIKLEPESQVIRVNVQ